ncbi:MAG: hypothetical protein JSW48_03760 [Betaproteobacteria bacterium]|nr:MAG: hypothetical protein JSW48_03760 [Betaproteobacteria bacterium]
MPTHKTAALVTAAALALPGAALAEDPRVPNGANLTFTTDYIFRGISQTDEKFDIQGGFDWERQLRNPYRHLGFEHQLERWRGIVRRSRCLLRLEEELGRLGNWILATSTSIIQASASATVTKSTAPARGNGFT